MTTTAPDQRPVLVTGGAGFVGSHIAQRLAGSRPVHVLDDLSAGQLINVPSQVVFHEGDIRCDQEMRALFRALNFGAVVHCAAQTSVARSMACPDEDWQINVRGTQQLIRLAEEFRVGRFVFLSSGGAIYGQTDAPATESDRPAPISHYGLNKFAAEQLLRVSSLSHAILRPANIYGPRQRSDLEGGVIAVFIERLLAHEVIQLHGNGQQRRDFVHVDDVVRAVELALEDDADQTWNVASGRSTAISDLLTMLRELTGSTSPVCAAPRRAGDIDCSVLSPARLLATGRWGPPLDLEAGLRRLLVER